MSTPSQFGPPSQSDGGGRTVLVVAATILGLTLLCCTGLCAGCYLVVGRTATVVQKGLAEGIEDFALMVPAYGAQAAVSQDQRVIERLGEPIEPVEFKRGREGKPNPSGETLQFDIKGPKGKAIVSVVAVQSDGEWKPRTITVTFEDGSVIDIPMAEKSADADKAQPESEKKGEP